MSERQKLVAAVGDLLLIIDRMHSRYQDDVSQGRAERMEELCREGREIAQPIIDSYPFGYGRSKTRLSTPTTGEKR